MSTNKGIDKERLSASLDAVIEAAEAAGADTNVYYITTLQRYRQQVAMLSMLEKAITEHGPTVTKEYVKGRENIVINPALAEYNKTATAANNTLMTLIRIVAALKVPSIMDAAHVDDNDL